MALSRDVVIRLLGDASSAQAAIKAAADAAEVSVAAYKRAEREQQKQADTARQAAQDQVDIQAQAADAMDQAAQAAMASGAVIAAGLALSARAAIDWQSAWAGVEKSVEGTPAQMDELEQSLRQLATTLPATHEEIAGVAEAAGQLGIARGDIVEFTKVAIALGVATNLSSEEAATGLAQLSNIMGTSSSDVDRMGATLVGLGNAGASTEADILAMSLRIAAAGNQAGMSEADVMGLANALSSMGVNAEAGGSSVSTVIKDINNAVLDGNDDLEVYARTAGMTAEQFAAAWRDDAAGALQVFVAGLGKVQASGGNVNTVLSELGLKDIQVADTMLRLSSNAGLLGQSLATGNKAWADNSALMNEANKRYQTIESQLQITSNAINDAAIDIGNVLLPVISTATQLVGDFARGFGELPGWMQGSVAIIGLLASTLLMAGGAFTFIGPKLAAFRLEMVMLTYSSSTAQAAVGRMGAFMMGPWGVAIGLATLAIGGLITWLGASGRASEESTSRTKDLASALRETNGAITDNIRQLRIQAAADADIGDSNLLEIVERATGPGGLPALTDALTGVRGGYEKTQAALDAYIKAHTHLVTRETNAGLHTTTEEIDAQGVAALDAKDKLAEMAGETGAAVAENERMAAAMAESGDAAGQATTTTDSLTAAIGGQVDATGQAADMAKELSDALKNLNSPTLDARDAARQFQEAIDAATEAVATNGRTLDINTDAGRANQAALDDIASAAMDQANAIVASGGSYDSFRNSLLSSRESLIATAKSMGMTQEEAVALADQILQIPDAALVNIAIPTYGQVTTQLTDVNNKVRGIPPQTWTNVGVISGPAIGQLEAVGFKTRTLPDGTVEVYADTGAAQRELNALVTRRYTVNVATNILGAFTGRQTGGPLAPGQVSWVGESGPELFQAGPAGGYVTPAGLSRSAAGAAPAGTPVGPSVRMDPIVIPAATPAIDYARLGAAVAAAVGGARGVSIGQIVTARNETGYELAERLAFTARTAGA